MEQYIGKKLFREIITYIIGCLSAGLLLMGIVFTIIAMISTDENNDMMDIATIGYSFAFICGIVFLGFLLSGNLEPPKQFKRSMKKLKDRELLELAQSEFENVKDKTHDSILTAHFIYFRGKGIIIPIEDIAWAYMQQINVSRAGGNGAPMNFRPWIYDIYGNEYTVVYVYNPKKFEHMSYMIGTLKNINKNIMLGYSKENQQIYNQKYRKK